MFDGNILVIAAHPDDEALGCGGTVAKLSQKARVDILFISDGEGARGNTENLEKRRVAACAAADCLGAQEPAFLDYPDNRLDTVPFLDIVQSIEKVIERLEPTTIITHFLGDLNIDHRITQNAVMTACRPLPETCVREIYAMEVLSSTEWTLEYPFSPNVFVDITDTFEIKRKALKFYHSEMRPAPHARSYEAVQALAILRGASVGKSYAEGFVLQRAVTNTNLR